MYLTCYMVSIENATSILLEDLNVCTTTGYDANEIQINICKNMFSKMYNVHNMC